MIYVRLCFFEVRLRKKILLKWGFIDSAPNHQKRVFDHIVRLALKGLRYCQLFMAKHFCKHSCLFVNYFREKTTVDV